MVTGFGSPPFSGDLSDTGEGDHEVSQAGSAWREAKVEERERMTALYAAIREAHAAGTPETQIAALAGVDRMTVRRALGKL